MMTDTQKETLKDLKNGKLNPKQKADFYYRMSNILRAYLDGIDEAVHLLNEIPDSYLKKIDFAVSAVNTMHLCEMILQKMSLSTVEADFNKTTIEAVKKFDLGEGNLKLPDDMPHEVKGCSIHRDLTESEAEITRRTIEHVRELEELLVPKREKISAQKFNTQVQPKIFSDAEKKGVQCRTEWDFTETPYPLMRLLDASVYQEAMKRAEHPPE